MIWVATFLAVLLHTAVVILFVPVPTGPFLTTSAMVTGAYIAFFFLMKNGFSAQAKHWLILTTYFTVAITDHLFWKSTYTFLYLFAFLPAAMNIFSFKYQKPAILIYTSFPLIYTLVTRFTDYVYPQFSLPREPVIGFMSVLNIGLAFLLFVTFSAYMIFNNLTKQQKLQWQGTALQATLDNSATAIWSIDRDFSLLATNIKYSESIQKEFGVGGLERGVNIRQHALWQKLPADLREQYYTVLSGQEIQQEITVNERFYEIKGTPIYDEKRNIIGATFGSRDITAKKNAIALLIKAKQDAEQAGEAKARFLSNMSHELRTPLNGIIGITRILQDEKMLPEQAANFKTLQDLSEHTLQIINNVLDLSKMEAGKASLENERFGLKRFLEKISSIFSGTARIKGLTFQVTTAGETDIYLKGDEVRLSQVLINLIGNSLKFTERGGVTLYVNTQDDTDPAFSLLRFSVKDTGIGIRKENIDKIFESFSQADSRTTRNFGGTGLGLSIAEKILNLMGSHISVESEYGKGSSFSFTLRLPLSATGTFQRIQPQASGSPDLSNVHILLAEDNRVNQVVATRLLEKWNSHVTVANNGKEAVEFAALKKFDVILMDLDMPVMDGYESASVIKKSRPDVPVIALTAAFFDDMTNYLTNKGFSDVVQKPFIPDDLYHKIMEVMHRA